MSKIQDINDVLGNIEEQLGQIVEEDEDEGMEVSEIDPSVEEAIISMADEQETEGVPAYMRMFQSLKNMIVAANAGDETADFFCQDMLAASSEIANSYLEDGASESTEETEEE